MRIWVEQNLSRRNRFLSTEYKNVAPGTRTQPSANITHWKPAGSLPLLPPSGHTGFLQASFLHPEWEVPGIHLASWAPLAAPPALTVWVAHTLGKKLWLFLIFGEVFRANKKMSSSTLPRKCEPVNSGAPSVVCSPSNSLLP